jgi:membrane protein YdbS with pleckstrin-like domain
MTEASGPGRPARGSLALYAVAFALVLVAGGALVVAARGFLESPGLLWASTACSVVAIVAAIVGLWLPRRR